MTEFVHYEFHEAANGFPLTTGQDFQHLKDSIRKSGLRNPIVLCDGKILDGRNRYRAIEQLHQVGQDVGIEVKTIEYDGDDPWAYAWDTNGERRDHQITADQKYLIWKEYNRHSHVLKERLRSIVDNAKAKRSEAAQERPRNDDGTLAAAPRPVEPTSRCTSSAPTGSAHAAEENKARTAKATLSATNRGAVERMDRLESARPDLARQVREGVKKPTLAMREMKRDEVSKRVSELPKGQYRVIYADPPWQYNDSRAFDEGDSSAAEDHYPTMSKAELCALDVRGLAAPESILFCWATFPLLPDALEVVKAWGFKYKTAFVWSKGRPNKGNYHNASAELLLVCTKGTGCTPETGRRPDQVQAIKREGGHSQKPESFRELVDMLYPSGPRIELFRRGDAPDGWEVWGNEAA